MLRELLSAMPSLVSVAAALAHPGVAAHIGASVVAQTEVDLQTLDEALGAGGLTGWDWARAGSIVLGGIIVARLVRWLLGRVLGRTTSATVAALVARLGGIVVGAFALVYALESLGVRIGPLLGALGIVGIAVAFALKDILENFVAGLLLQFSRPFDYGDEIVSGDTEGTVTSVDARTVTIATPDGETVHLPSSKVITDAIVNHTARGRRRTSLPVGVAYGTDLTRAANAFREAIDGLDDVVADPAPEVLVEAFGESSIDLVVRYWHEPSIAAYWRAQNAVALAIDEACRRHDIHIPFPQRTLWWGDGASEPDTPPRR